jgi:DNA-binding NarL/FixJ family response regulator
MIRVLVVEDHHLVREGICKLLEDAGDIKVIAEADNGQDALALYQRLQPQVLVLDISMPEMNGLEALGQLQCLQPHPAVVILSMYGDQATVQRALQLGALGYVLKQTVAGELLAAVRAASLGSMYLSAGVSAVLSQSWRDGPPRNKIDRLSPRELEVVWFVLEGLSARQIAERLNTSVKTVEKQKRDAMRKLEVDNLPGLVRICLENGLALGQTPSYDGSAALEET